MAPGAPGLGPSSPSLLYVALWFHSHPRDVPLEDTVCEDPLCSGVGPVRSPERPDPALSGSSWDRPGFESRSHPGWPLAGPQRVTALWGSGLVCSGDVHVLLSPHHSVVWVRSHRVDGTWGHMTRGLVMTKREGKGLLGGVRRTAESSSPRKQNCAPLDILSGKGQWLPSGMQAG